MTSNRDLVSLTGLPNLDTITDPDRLLILADIAERHSAYPSNAGRRARAFTIYSERAADKADEEEEE